MFANLAFFAACLIYAVNCDNCNYATCTDCASSPSFQGCAWCVNKHACTRFDSCNGSYIQGSSYNCPRTPDPANPFNETLARNYVLPYLAGAYSPYPSGGPVPCLKKWAPTTTFYDSIELACDTYQRGDYCKVYTAYDSTLKKVILSFRGTSGDSEIFLEWLTSLDPNNMEDFFDIGRVFKYWRYAFFTLWNGRLETQFETLRQVFPNYKILITGHSLGGSLASVCAAYLIKEGLATSSEIELYTFGAPRAGDSSFAAYVEKNVKVPAAFRIVHALDQASEFPSIKIAMHHRYPNDMSVGEEYQVCPYADLPGKCASYLNKSPHSNLKDNKYYYDPPQPIDKWGQNCCAERC